MRTIAVIITAATLAVALPVSYTEYRLRQRDRRDRAGRL